MKLAMTIMVYNEADVIEDNLRFHRAQGVDFFIALDNGSTDGTREILESYERAGILSVVSMPGPLLKVLKEGTTKIGRMAHEMGADWVIHTDADEFWWPVTGSNLKESLEAVPERFGIILAPRTEFLPRPDGAGSFAERLLIREARFRRPPKTAHRAHPLINLWTTHPIDVWVNRGSSPRSGLVGKPALRAQPTHLEENELDLVLAPEFPIGVLHFPLRSLEQYRSKVEVLGDNRMFDRSAEAREIRDAYETGRLADVYENLVLDEQAVGHGLAEGWLVEDTEFRDYLLACPGILDEAESPPGARAWPEERRQAALDELGEDGMYAISRYMQTVASKKRRRHKQIRELKRLRGDLRRSEHQFRRLHRQLERRSQQLRNIRGSRWWKMRPRLPKPRRAGH
jgi:glycosyl transferase family 2